MSGNFNIQRVSRLIELLEPTRLTQIADVGANPVHVPAYDGLRQMGACDVWGFEPLPDAFAQLQDSAGPNEHYLPYAIGNGEAGTFNICASEPFSSLLPPDQKTLDYLGRWHKAMDVKRKIDVQTKRLDDLDELPQPDFLKIDIQGGELDVFRNGREKLSKAVAIVSEVGFVPLYENQPLLHEQAAELSAQGFDLMQFISLKSKALGSANMARLNWRQHQNQLIDGDAVFIRRLYNPDDVSDEELKHLAILSDGVLGFFDLTMRILALLFERGAVTSQKKVEGYIDLVPYPKS